MSVRRLVRVWVAGLVAFAGLAVAATPAPAATPISLLVSQSTAFGYLGHSCGGIQEQAFATGFDTATGFPIGAVYLQTRCGGSGRGGGYTTTTYSAWITATWDDTGAEVSTARAATAPAVDPAYTASDGYGNQLQNVLSAVNVAPSTCTVGNTSYCTYRAYLTLSPTFVPAPRVTAASVTLGPASGGTALVLTGTGFSAATAVQFGDLPAASFTVVNDTTIDVVAPSAPPGTVALTVTSPGGTSAPSTAAMYTFVGIPTVSGISPDRGPVAGGTTIEITGSGFTGTTSVSFGDTTAFFVVNSDTSISAVSPAVDAAEPRDVIVAGVGGTSAPNPADVFTFSTVSCTGPCVSVGDASVLEGDSGTRTMTFPVTLSAPATTNVTVHYAVTGITAVGGTTYSAGVDFKSKAGTLTFAVGTNGLTPVEKAVSVTVYGDTDPQLDQTLAVTLSNPSTPYGLGRDSGTGTIVNDDGIVAGPTAGIGDASIVQISSGTASLVLPVTLSAPATGTVTISYVVAPDTAAHSSTASGGGDFGGRSSGTITFAAGTFSKKLAIPIWADPNPSFDKSFVVTLTGLSGESITLVKDTAIGTILAL